MREVAKSYASEQSVARSWNRKPVLINGADIAGLALAQTLRSGQVPFLIFERHSKNSPMATKRQWRFHFDSRYFDGLAQRMGLPQAGVLLDALKNDIKDRQTRVMTRNLEQVLTSDIDIKYGHHLSVEGINVEGGAISPHYSHEKIIHRTEGSMIVGADGQFSTVRRHHSNTMLSDWLHQLPALVYRVSLHVPITFWDTHIKPFVDHQRNARMTRNNVFLSLG